MKFGCIKYEYHVVDGKPVVTSFAYTVDPDMGKMTKEAIAFAPFTNQRSKLVTEYNITEAE